MPNTMPEDLLYTTMSCLGSLPDTRPTTGDTIIKEEVNYEIIVEWHDHSISVNLYIRPHSDHQQIVPDDARACTLHDAPTTPSTLDDLPANFQRQFRDSARILKNKYDLKDPDEPAICTSCIRDGSDEILHFTQFLTV